MECPKMPMQQQVVAVAPVLNNINIKTDILFGTVITTATVALSYITYKVMKSFEAGSVEGQFIRAAADHNVKHAVEIFKDHAGTSVISEKAVNNMLKFLCSSATQEQTQRDTALIIEFLEVAKESNYSFPNFDIKTQAPDCLELVGVADKIQELVVEGG